MKKISFSNLSNFYLIFNLTFTLLIISNVTFGQTPINFSGAWVLNSFKSSSIYSNLSATVIIGQDTEANTFSLNIKSESPEIELAKQPSKYILDGKKITVVSSKERSTQISANWSSDQKKIIVSEFDLVVEGRITTKSMRTTVYSLENNEILIITIYEPVPEGFKTTEVERHIMVFNRAVSLSFPKRQPLIVH